MEAVIVDKDYGSVTYGDMEKFQDAFRKAGIDLILNHFKTEDEIIAGCQDAEIIVATGNPPITRRVIEALPKLKFVQRVGAGYNTIDLDAATEHGVYVLYLPGYCARELADLATAMIMGLVRNLGFYDRSIRQGGWPKCKLYIPGNVRNMTLGIFGFGAAGRQLYKIFSGGFGTKVIACDPYLTEEIKSEYPDVDFVSFDELLTRSDIISLHANLTPETAHKFDKDAFLKMKKTAMIINTSRGGVIDQKALAWALEQGEIRYAGLDVFEQEPPMQEDPLMGMDNVVFSAHSGLYGEGAKVQQINMVCELIPRAVAEGVLPGRCVANADVLKKNTELTIL